MDRRGRGRTVRHAELPPGSRGTHLMAMRQAVPRYTAAEVRDFPDHRVRYEVIRGELFVTPAPGLPHQRAVLELATFDEFDEILLRNGDQVVLTIGNTGRTIPAGENIFERFHHRSTPSAVSGHGIGLNLARELARLHGGELRLVRSGNDWTEFEVRFSPASGVNGVA